MTQKLRKEEFGRLKLKKFPQGNSPGPLKEHVPKLKHCWSKRTVCVCFFFFFFYAASRAALGYILFVNVENKNNRIWNSNDPNYFSQFQNTGLLAPQKLSLGSGLLSKKKKSQGCSEKMIGLWAPNQIYQGSSERSDHTCISIIAHHFMRMIKTATYLHLPFQLQLPEDRT